MASASSSSSNGNGHGNDNSYEVHRLRIGDWTPSSIKSIATNHYSSKVAVGREDGDIEILDSTSKYYTQARIPGMKNFSLQSLVWSTIKEEQNRLFGISLRGFLFEVDLGSFCLKNIRDSYGGTAWCLQASIRTPTLAVGCEDGAVRLFKYSDGSALEYHRSLPTTGSRVLSVAFHPLDPKLFVGCSDGTIRCMEENTGRVLFRLTADFSKRGPSTSIWTLQALKDNTLVSGDSQGNIQIWDVAVGVLISTFRQHTADVYSVIVSKDENCIFAAGVDSKVVCIQKVTTAISGGSNNDMGDGGSGDPDDSKWIYTHSHRAHSHDIMALAIANEHLDDSSSSSSSSSKCTLLSGGLDTKICTYDIRQLQAGSCRSKWIPAAPCNSLVQHSAQYEVMALRHRNHIDLWSVHLQAPVGDEDESSSNSNSNSNGNGNSNSSSGSGSSSSSSSSGKDCKLGMRLETKGNDHIHCFALSPNGRFLLVSSATGLRMWLLSGPSSAAQHKVSPNPKKKQSSKKRRLEEEEEEEARALLPTGSAEDEPAFSIFEKIELPDSMSYSSGRRLYTALAFSEDSRQFAAFSTPDGVLSLYSVTASDENKSSTHVPAASSKTKKKSRKQRASSVTDEDEDEEEEEEEEEETIMPTGKDKVSVTLSLLQTFDHLTLIGRPTGQAGYTPSIDEQLSQCVKKISFSRDSQFLAVADHAVGVYLYDIDRNRMHWKLPPFPCPVTDFKIITGLDSDLLVVLLADNSFLMYDINGVTLTEWSKRNGRSLPRQLLQMPGTLGGIANTESQPNVLVLYGQGYCVMVDVTKDVPKLPKVVTSATTHLLGKTQQQLRKKILKQLKQQQKKKESEGGAGGEGGGGGEGDLGIEEESGSNFVIFNIYRNLIHVGCMDKQQLVVIENPFIHQMQELPDMLERKRYGT